MTTRNLRQSVARPEETKALIDAGLMRLRPNIQTRVWQCMIRDGRRVCRDRHNGLRLEAKDSQNMADHILRHHAARAAQALGEDGPA